MPLTVQEILDDKRDQGGRTHGLAPGAPVREAVATMIREDIGSVLVLEGGVLAGIITLRELLKGLASQGARLLDARADEVMEPEPGHRPSRGLRRQPARHDDGAPREPRAGPEGRAPRRHRLVPRHRPQRGQGCRLRNRLLKQYIKNWPQP